MYSELRDYIRSLDESDIANNRLALLQEISNSIAEKLKNENSVNLVFICTHNSRRSQMAQFWAQALGSYFEFSKLECFSGGTEETAVYPTCISALTDAGFSHKKLSSGTNPIHALKYAENGVPVFGYSKLYDSFTNPSNEFIAIMTCDRASEACPLVQGSSHKFSWTFQDPKSFDGTQHELAEYKSTCREIASELKYIFQYTKTQL